MSSFSDFRTMLKGVKKGIKKKIKGKKDKKEDDLFDPEQLEKYKRELEEAKKARQQDDESGSSAGGAAGSSGGGHEQDEEWLRFKQLTSGVDVLVNKVSTDLDRIKESSFFQRNKPSEQNKLFAGERPAGAILPSPEREKAPHNTDAHEGEDGDEQAVLKSTINYIYNIWALNVMPVLLFNFQVPAEDGATALEGEDTTDDPFAKVPESPEDIVPVELDDSLFDTAFVDAVATGDIKLTYIPDSPTEEEGDDPFDTSGVTDIVKRIEEEEKKARRQVNLGDAVDVLTGKGDKTGIARPRIKAGEMKAKARPRPHAVNLLGDFDDASVPTPPLPEVTRKGKGGTVVEKPKPKDIFDQILDEPSTDTGSPLLEKVDILPSAASESIKASSAEPQDGIKDVISEFDIIGQLDPISGSADSEPLPSGIPSSIPSSIAALLAPAGDPEEDELDDEFAALAAESVHKGPAPAEVEEAPEEEEEDPFDTSYLDVSAGKCELKIIENEILGDVQSSEKEGKPAGGNLEDDDDDFDFNPRLGESPPKNLQIQNAPKLNPLEDLSPMNVKAPTIEPHVKAAGPTLVETTEGTEGEGVPEVDEDVDPFDTSRLEAALPGKAELKLLEAELSSMEQGFVEPPKLPESIATAIIKGQQTLDEEEFDFDPRKDEVKHHPLDIHDASHQTFDTVSKVLTPQLEEDIEIDPFDTSAVAASGLIPGPLELRLLEDELVSPTVEAPPTMPQPPPPVKMTRTFSDEEFDPRCGQPAPVIPTKPAPTTEDIFDSAMDFAVDKPLTPSLDIAPVIAPEPMLCPTNADDPFDTSGIQIENYLAKSELRQVEEELLNAPVEPPRQLPVVVAVELKRSHQPMVSEPPPPPQQPAAPHLLEAMTPTEDSIKPLTPIELEPVMSGVISVFNPSSMADPFDTSIADGFIPGKIEIKMLEEELGVGAGGRRLSDDEFDPRGVKHPSAQMVSHPLTPMPMQPVVKPAAPANPPQPGEPDPFDTSSTDVNMPGKAELKALEAELL